MEAICILIGLGLAVLGGVIAYTTGKKRRPSRSEPPPMPPRARLNASTVSPGRTSAQRNRPSPSVQRSRPSPPPRQLPPRRPASGMRQGSGPRGIKPWQFPCCPYDKQRNLPGARQLIFWDQAENCYHCSRGHKFKSNGGLL